MMNNENPTEDSNPLEDELGKYENQWVAILEHERRIVGSGKTSSQAKGDAESRGYSETTLLKVPQSGRYFAYCL
jgi:hypothetical protein